ncbi:MAG TPA: tRNA pseudouridine(38-40) synthase TruA [Leucothrix mucor]|uniref:tRNA pseudouridine synthase A n=1 Tax=Leucothrix mucor TaxID=45248 RepID=A0A7V2T3B0_LEUMU|nr:tRNA pseudouridine(38-40) synthase TruA [Leucothrix mucor]
MKYALCVEYDGTPYCGWQKLSHAPSVQEEVEKSLSKVANHSVEVVCAGRTDSGVHGIGQVIHFESDSDRNDKAWLLGGNTNLPFSISFQWVKVVDNDFHARFSALDRRYRYIILNRKARPALLHQRVAWFHSLLDERKMQQAADNLIGEMDYSSFRASSCQARHANREIKEIKITRNGDYITIDICANAFLHHMVRNIVGSLFDVGLGIKSPQWFVELLAIKDRTKAGVTAPACGLYFVSVSYPEKYQIPKNNQSPKFVV